MLPTFTVLACWMIFGGTHIGLATAPVRQRLVRALGEMGFTVVFYLVASVSFAVLVNAFAQHRAEGVAGLDLGRVAVVRWAALASIVAGVTLIGAALASYPRSPTALFGQPIREPHGLERVTRHPFFAGVAMLGLAHALLATRLVGTAFFAALFAFSALGAWHQDVKLLARRGRPYRDYLAATSAIPFAAIVTGRQRLVWREVPFTALAAGFGGALALRWGHDGILARGGLWLIVAVVGGGTVAGFEAGRRARRLAARGGPIERAPVAR